MFNVAFKLKVFDYTLQHNNRAAALSMPTILVVYVSIIINATMDMRHNSLDLKLIVAAASFQKIP